MFSYNTIFEPTQLIFHSICIDQLQKKLHYSFSARSGLENGGEDSALPLRMQEQTLLSIITSVTRWWQENRSQLRKGEYWLSVGRLLFRAGVLVAMGRKGGPRDTRPVNALTGRVLNQENPGLTSKTDLLDVMGIQAHSKF